MKTVRTTIFVDLVVPIEYQIELKFNGDKSYLKVIENHAPDVTEDVMDLTVKMGEQLASRLKLEVKVEAKFERISHHQLSFEFIGTEEQLVTSLFGELDLLRQAYFPSAFPQIRQPINR